MRPKRPVKCLIRLAATASSSCVLLTASECELTARRLLVCKLRLSEGKRSIFYLHASLGMGFSCGDSSVKLLGIASLPKKLCQKEIPPSPKKETPLPEGGNCLTEVTLDNANCRLSTLIPAYYRPFPHLLTRSRLYLPYPPRSLLTASSSSFSLYSLFIPSSFSLHSLFHSLFILSLFPLHPRLFPPIPAFPHPFPTYRFFPLVSSLRLMLVKRL